MKKTLLRIAGFILGTCFIVLGIHLLISPLHGDMLEKLNIATSLFVGTVFVIYGIRGEVIKGPK